MNGLAAIAMIEKNFSQAAALYKEALHITKEHSEDFRLDPLLNIHILHNLAEILPLVTDSPEQPPLAMQQYFGCSEMEIENDKKLYRNAVKRQKIGEKGNSSFAVGAGNLPGHTCNDFENALKDERKCDYEQESLRIACEQLKNKYLSAFSSKLCAAQQDFKKSFVQVHLDSVLWHLGAQYIMCKKCRTLLPSHNKPQTYDATAFFFVALKINYKALFLSIKRWEKNIADFVSQVH